MNNYCVDCIRYGECEHMICACESYEKGRADRDKEIAEHSVFFSNKPIEDIVLDARAYERIHIVEILFGIDRQVAELVKEILNNEKGQK